MVRVGEAAAEIVTEAESWGADVILVGSRGQTGIARVLTGSVARNVLMAGRASVLVSRSAAADPA